VTSDTLHASRVSSSLMPLGTFEDHLGVTSHRVGFMRTALGRNRIEFDGAVGKLSSDVFIRQIP
jgi:hypothetical protein